MRTALLLVLLVGCASSKSAETAPAAAPASTAPPGPAAGPASTAPQGPAATPAAAPPLASQANVFKATLTAANEVPAPTVDASKPPTGTATFTVGLTSVSYSIKVTNLTSAYTACHIHAGAAGVAGPVIVPLTLTAGAAGEASGEGKFSISDIKPKADGSTMNTSELVAAFQSGSTYVNVHTANNKPGEARGQIQ